LHTNAIAHRDIKLENIVLDAEGNARLVDVGAAKEGGAHTFLHSMQGTPAYMAPEVAQSRVHKGGPADIWALGVLLYNLISGGAFPFWGRSMEELKRNITAQPLRLPNHLSPACRDLITQLLQKSSTSRLSAADILKHRWLASRRSLPPAGASDELDVEAAIAAEAAQAAANYRGELHAARAATAQRLQQSQQPYPAGAPHRRGMAAQYAHGARDPITGGVRDYASPASRPGSARSSAPDSPRSNSKLANLMSGGGTRGMPMGAAGRVGSSNYLRR